VSLRVIFDCRTDEITIRTDDIDNLDWDNPEKIDLEAFFPKPEQYLAL